MATNYVRGASITCAASRAEIQEMLSQYGATGFRTGSENGRTMIAFTADRRRFRFLYEPPGTPEPAGAARSPQQRSFPRPQGRDEFSRRYWHKLSMLVRAKLEAVSAGIASFEDEFLAYMVLPGGETVAQNVRPGIARAYATGVRPASLGDGGR
ncbi:hypothetical protein [Arthrobacter sp. USHLN218]|uniref:hypothetical protein n=1 Tax=Arthrobacter sp. USHLN218 TaxID=3081232 RepID=UPI00301B4293